MTMPRCTRRVGTVTTQLGNLVKAIRKHDLGMSQKALAERSGLEQTHISKIERGALSQPEKETLDMLAFGLRVPPERLYIASYGGRDTAIEPEPLEVSFYGPVPADTVRWVAATEGGEMRRVLPEWIGTRSPKDFFIVEASGDCLFASEGIATGTHVLLERIIDGRPEPRNGDVVLVRIGDEYTLKRWFETGATIELRDGSDAVKHRMSKRGDYTVLGREVMHWTPRKH